MPSRPRVVAFSGSAKRPSRTRILGRGARSRTRTSAADRIPRSTTFSMPGLASARRSARTWAQPAERLIEAIEGADALIVGAPVYQGGYAGLFKHVFDFVDPARMAGKPVVLTATGGGLRHALVVEHSLRPLFGFFAALCGTDLGLCGLGRHGRWSDPGSDRRGAARCRGGGTRVPARPLASIRFRRDRLTGHLPGNIAHPTCSDTPFSPARDHVRFSDHDRDGCRRGAPPPPT